MELNRRLSLAFLEAHPNDAALLLEGLPTAEVAALLEQLPLRTVSLVVAPMVPSSAVDSLSCLSPERAGAILSQLPFDAAARLLRRMSKEAQAERLASMPAGTSDILERLLRYPPQTAGALMDPTVLALPDDISTNEARARVRRSAEHVLYYLYVVNRAHTLVGVLNLRELLLATGKEPLASVMRPQVARLAVHSDRTAILTHPGWREFHALPVVDENNLFLGALRYETLRSLEADFGAPRPTQTPLGLALALVELYWIGVGRLLGALRPPLSPPAPRLPERRPSDGK